MYDSGEGRGDERESYRLFLSNIPRFRNALTRVLSEWPISCEQFLSNEHINRIAWLGQSSMCIDSGVPARFRGGFRLLTINQQNIANQTALEFLNLWLRSRGESEKFDSLSLYDDEADATIPLSADNSIGTIARVQTYIQTWERCGYADGISDEVPGELARKLLAPSYRAICCALLKNDLPLKSLGFVPRQSKYYGILKRMEIEARPSETIQLRLFQL